MSINLCIDRGNSHVKAAVFDGDAIIENLHFIQDEAIEQVAALIEKHRPAKAILCSVADHPAELTHILKERVKNFILMDGNARLPIANAYASDTLGPDRVVLATAAHLLYPGKNNLVVSLGTCITYNFVQSNRTFRGGGIAPGMHMRFQAMHDYTARLPLVSPDGDLRLLGYDTETCIRSGAILGMAAEIDGIIAEYKGQYPDFNAVLTGGDALLFATKIKSKIFADPDLLLKGLNLILNYNVPIPR